MKTAQKRFMCNVTIDQLKEFKSQISDLFFDLSRLYETVALLEHTDSGDGAWKGHSTELADDLHKAECSLEDAFAKLSDLIKEKEAEVA